MNEVLARITLDSNSPDVGDVSLNNKPLRFKCKRCAAFCCRLGGPTLTERDVQRIIHAGYKANDFLDPSDGEFMDNPRIRGRMKSKKNGSCVFLKSCADRERFECSIYNSRPVLCRLYPFTFEKAGSTIELKIIPCCRGLNHPDGRLVDEKFIVDYLLAPLLEALESF